MMTDYLQRQKDLDNLITVIKNLSYLNKGVTFALNGPWGSGKTFLLNKLQEALSTIPAATNVPQYFVVRYDCWKNNYYSEPIIPMLSAIIEALDYESNNIKSGILDAIKDSASEYIGIMLKNTIGINPINIVKQLDEHIEQLHSDDFAFDNIIALKKALNKVRDSLKELSTQTTIIFIVDELDRCLPTYSIHVLENIHHIFSDIDNFITILAIDQSEFAQVIKTAYGPNIDVSAYLKKVIDFNIQLDLGKPDPNYLDKYSDFSKQFAGTNETRKWSYDIIPKIMANIDIRTQEKIWKRAELLHHMITQKQLDYSCLVYELIVLTEEFIFHDSQTGLRQQNFEETLTALLKPYSELPTSTIYHGNQYIDLSDHPSARIIWYREGQKLLQNSDVQHELSDIRIDHACSYANSIKEEDELMQEFTKLSHIIQ